MAEGIRPGTPGLLAAAATALSTTYGPVRLREIEALGGSSRTRVMRAQVEGSADLPSTVVVKAYVEATSFGAEMREPAALGLLTASGWPYAPRLLAVSGEPALVVLEDLGAGRPDLAGALLGEDPRRAEARLLDWADAIARLHKRTSGWGTDLATALGAAADRVGSQPPSTNLMPDTLRHAAELLAEQLPLLGVEPTPEALDIIRRLDELLRDEEGCWALTPTDACPDNNIITDRGMVLLDFEGAHVRHIAWDAAYLTVPWPTCWCSWALPNDVAARTLARWRSTMAAVVPHVATAGFEADLAVAEAGWAMISTAWFLAGAVREADEPPTPPLDARAPTRRAMLLHRLSRAAAMPDGRLAALRDLASGVHAAAHALWGETPLAFAPAFRGTDN